MVELVAVRQCGAHLLQAKFPAATVMERHLGLVLVPETALSGLPGPDALPNTVAWKDLPLTPAHTVLPRATTTALPAALLHQRMFGIHTEVVVGYPKRYGYVDMRVDPEFRTIVGSYNQHLSRVPWKLVADDLCVSVGSQ